MPAQARHKTHQFSFGWRPPKPFSARRRILSRMRKKQRKLPHTRFSHSPPGHTCGLPCCSEDLHIHIRLNNPASKYSCMPAHQPKQADLENNFTFRRSRLVSGRPTFTNKFFSLQTRSVKARAGLPRFHDDSGLLGEICEGGEGAEGWQGGAEDEADQSASAAHESLRQYRASIETDTDADPSNPQPYLDRVYLDSRTRIRTPVRYLQPWECFHNREITLPDHPGTPRRMVFLDYRPGESHDGAVGGGGGGDDEWEDEEERIEVYSSGYNPTPKKVAYTTSTATIPTTTTTTHSSPSSSTHTTSTSRADSLATSAPRVSYSGAVRPITMPTPVRLPKSALKKPKTPDQSEQGKLGGTCTVCQGRTALSPSDAKAPDVGHNSEGRRTAELIYAAPLEERTVATAEDVASSLSDADDLYDGHVYDLLCDVVSAARDQEEGDNSKGTRTSSKGGKSEAYDRLKSPKPPPVPPTRRNEHPKPDKGRKAMTPPMSRRSLQQPRSTRNREEPEERYSTFPTRRRHNPHHYEKLEAPGDTGKGGKGGKIHPTSGTEKGVDGKGGGGGGGKDSFSGWRELGKDFLSLGGGGGGGGCGGKMKGVADDGAGVRGGMMTKSLSDNSEVGGKKKVSGSSEALDIFSVADDKNKLLEDSDDGVCEPGEEEEEEEEEGVYEAVGPSLLLQDPWGTPLPRDKGGGSLNSVDSARLSHTSYGSYGCTCLSGDVSRQMTLIDDDVIADADASLDGGGKDAGEKKGGFLADNPITLIL